MTFVFWWPVLYGLVLLGVLALWGKTEHRSQKTEVGNQKSENRGQKNPVTALRSAVSDLRGARRIRASGRDAREITSIRREASLFDWGPGSALGRALSTGPKPRAPRPHFFLSRYGVRRTPVPGGGTPGAHARCLPAGRRDRVTEAMWRETPS